MLAKTSFAGIHQIEGATCVDCHTDEKAFPQIHKEATVENAIKRATKLRQTSVDKDVCFSCHGTELELAQKTQSCVILTDAEGVVVNPHVLPQHDDHAGIECGSCHTAHEQTNVLEVAPEKCRSCHHQNVYQCDTCH